jgi:hypothetical protein
VRSELSLIERRATKALTEGRLNDFRALFRQIPPDNGACPVPAPTHARNARSPRRTARATARARTVVAPTDDGPPEPPLRAPRVAAAPLVISDASAPAVVGLTARQFRAFVREHGLPAVKAGRRTLVRAEVLLEAIDRLSGSAPRPAGDALDEDTIVELAARGAK